MMMMMMRIVGC